MAERPGDLTIEGAQLIFKNFSGEEGPYNAKGERSFSLRLDEELALALRDQGWNVKQRDPREGYEDDGPMFYLQVTVKFDVRPPRVVTMGSIDVAERGVAKATRTALTEQTIGTLDWAAIENVDLVLNPYLWEVNGKTGIKAYLKTMFVVLVEDDLDRKYAYLDDEED